MAKLDFAFLFCIFIFIHLISRSSLKIRRNEAINSHENQITLKVKDNGIQQLFSYEYKLYVIQYPKNIYSNGNTLAFSTTDLTINVIDKDSPIKMVWDKPIRTGFYMFCNLSNIIALDLSSFDLSNATSGSHMFEGCTSLVC